MERSLFVITIKPNILHIQRANIMKLKCTFLAKNVYINAFNCVTMLLFPPRIKEDVGRMLLCKRHYSSDVGSSSTLICSISRWNKEVSDRRRWSAGVAASEAVHGGSCCLRSTSAKKSLSAFSRSRLHQSRILFYYSTTYRTQLQYIFMPPPVKCSFKAYKKYFIYNCHHFFFWLLLLERQKIIIILWSWWIVTFRFSTQLPKK